MWFEQSEAMLETLRINQQSIWNSWTDLPGLVGTLARQPTLGPISPDLAQRSATVFEAWLGCVGALQRYEALGLQTWTRIGGRIVANLTERDDSREPVTSLRALLLHWVNTGDAILMDVYRSENYLAVQRDLLESLMRYRIALQAVFEVVARETGQPTRRELDDAHQAIHALRREMRKLKRMSRANGSTPADLN